MSSSRRTAAQTNRACTLEGTPVPTPCLALSARAQHLLSTSTARQCVRSGSVAAVLPPIDQCPGHAVTTAAPSPRVAQHRLTGGRSSLTESSGSMCPQRTVTIAEWRKVAASSRFCVPWRVVLRLRGCTGRALVPYRWWFLGRGRRAGQRWGAAWVDGRGRRGLRVGRLGGGRPLLCGVGLSGRSGPAQSKSPVEWWALSISLPTGHCLRWR